MRLAHVVVLLAASFLLASDVSSMDTDQVSNAASPNQRLLRAHHTAIESDTDSEDRSLKKDEMINMIRKGMTKEDYAAKLGITENIKMALERDLVKFMATPQYKQYSTYMNFLNAMKNEPEFKASVAKIKEKSREQANK